MKEKYFEQIFYRVENFGGAIVGLDRFPCESLLDFQKEIAKVRGEEWQIIYYNNENNIPKYLKKIILVVDEEINTLDYLLKSDIILEDVIVIFPLENVNNLYKMVHEANKEWVVK